MPTIHPDGWQALEGIGHAQREIETLHVLAKGLPDKLHVFHGVHWTRIERGYGVIGEIDFVIVAPSGRILLIEQKSGFLPGVNYLERSTTTILSDAVGR